MPPPAPTANRPGSLSFVAIVLIVVGAWSLLGALLGGPMMIIQVVSPDPGPQPMPKFPQQMDNAELQRRIAREVPSMYPVSGGLMIVSVFFGIAQVFSGIMLWKMNPRWRMPAILASLGKLLFAFGGHAYQILVVGPIMGTVMEKAMEEWMPAGGPQGQAMPFQINWSLMMQAASALGACVGIIQLAIFLTITVILCTSTVKDALAGKLPPPRTSDEEELEHRRHSKYEGYDDDSSGDSPRSSGSDPPDTGITDRP
jgi:hypothetical protein